MAVDTVLSQLWMSPLCLLPHILFTQKLLITENKAQQLCSLLFPPFNFFLFHVMSAGEVRLSKYLHY